ncbi:MAG: hypothetical protein JRG89_06115 [Deltaproteobacteria bacterium]|nr:hypothetical protein [Deltaproteobacteria bacterium]
MEFDRGLGKGSSQTYRLVFDSAEIPPAEVGISFKTGGQADVSTIRGPGCVDPTLKGGVERVYVRDIATGTTEIVSVADRADCSEEPTASDDPSGNPDVTQGGELVFFDSLSSFTPDDGDATSDVYVYDRATCGVSNLTAGVEGPASNPTTSNDGSIVAFEAGETPEIFVLDTTTGDLQSIGFGQDPDLSADGSKLVYVTGVAGVSQVFLYDLAAQSTTEVSVLDDGSFFPLGAGAPSVANGSATAFETPPGDVDSEVFVRDVAKADTSPASTVGIGQNICTGSPCGAFSPSISDDGRFVAFVVRGLLAIDEIMIKDLVSGSVTPLTRMAGADGDSYEPSLGESGDFIALTSFASQLGGVSGAAAPNVFLEGPDDPSKDRRALLGIIDLGSCGGGVACTPRLTGETVTKGAVFEGDVAVVGSPVRVVDVGGGGAGYSVTSFGREGEDVALSEDYVCAIATTDESGNPGQFAACGARSGSSLSDLTVAGAAIEASEIGLCGARAIVLASDGMLYAADLDVDVEASAVQLAQDFALGQGLDLDDDGRADTCLVAFRTLETDLGVDPATVGNRDLDADDLAMFVLGTSSIITDCGSSTTDCPGQACELFNYQVGRESVLFITDESEENFGFTPEQDICSPGTDINGDGLCDLTVRRCTAAGFVSEGTTFGQSANLFSQQRFQNDGENTVVSVGFCGTSPANVRLGQLCDEDLDCLSEPGETCQLGFVALSALADGDGDELPDIFDNCPLDPNPGQEDADEDGFGDACDTFTCGDGNLQEAEVCDEGEFNGAPGSFCSAQCACTVNFEVTETLKPGSNGNTPITIFGSAAADGSGCVNLETTSVGGAAAKSIVPMSLRLSATRPTQSCPASGGGPDHNLDKNQTYRSHLADDNGDGIEDLRVHVDTTPIGGDATTTVLYLTGRFSETSGRSAGTCFEAITPVKVSGK